MLEAHVGSKTRLPDCICHLVGFGSLKTFERAFKERFGMTPSEFRRAQRLLSS
ncbi:MAG: AraC family transcriptional regulator [Acidobacteriota bacterium]